MTLPTGTRALNQVLNQQLGLQIEPRRENQLPMYTGANIDYRRAKATRKETEDLARAREIKERF